MLVSRCTIRARVNTLIALNPTLSPCVARYTGLLMQISPARALASSPRNQFLLKALAYVKKVDEQQAILDTSPSKDDRIAQLMAKIANKPELLYMLAVFHNECNRIGINQDPHRAGSKLQFYIAYLVRLKPVHDNFWEICRMTDIANRTHELQWDRHDLGLLDPRNFDRDTYRLLQKGVLGSVDFRDVAIMSFTRPDFDKYYD